MADDLETRLRTTAKAFDGLLSLIPAEDYYAQDNSDQYLRKKQTKEQKREARKAKLRPESIKSAKDVLDDMDRKRKRELEVEDYSDVNDVTKEQPREGLKPVAKKQRKDQQTDKTKKEPKALKDAAAEERARKKKQTQDQKRKEKAQRRKEADARFATKHGKKEMSTSEALTQTPKAEVKAGKPKTAHGKTSKEDKLDRSPNNVEDAEQNHLDEGVEDVVEEPDDEDAIESNIRTEEVESSNDDREETDNEQLLTDNDDEDNEVAKLDLSGLADEDAASTATPSPAPESIASAIPSTSSSSSIIPPATANELAGPAKATTGNAEKAAQKERLAARMEALRAARNADGIDGKPARNRQELLEARRRKAEQRKQHKKEMRNAAKDEEQKRAAEAELARLRGSGSPLTSSDIFSPRFETNNFHFGRVAFDDGVEFDSNLSALREHNKKKGAADAKTTLQAAEKKAARLNGLDADKRRKLEEKDLWLAAKKKAHGEKVRDDTSLLKKTLKRKEKQKGKSEKEWTDRIEGVAKGKEMKQKKREDNLRKRKEEKGNKGKKGKKPTGKKTKARPGFEGSIRSKAK